MKQVFLHKGSIHVEEVAPPLVQDHHVIVRVHHSCISTGTESATINASEKSLIEKFSSNLVCNSTKIFGALKEHGMAVTIALAKEKLHQIMPLGYSCSGRIVAVGAYVEQLHVGDYVACAGAMAAYHADIVSVPQNLVAKINKQSIIRDASITAIGAIALQGVRRANVQLGEKVCVIGLGLIGQLTTQLLKHAGCSVIGIDIQQERLDLALKMGAEVCLNPLNLDIIKELEFATGHHGVDVTIITASSNSGAIIQQAMHVTRRKGRVVVVGDVKLDFDREPFYAKEIDLLISCSCGPGRYDVEYEQYSRDYPYPYVRWTEQRNMAYFVDLLEKNAISIKNLITHEFTIDHAADAYTAFKKDRALGVILSYNAHKDIDEYEVRKLLFHNTSPTEIKPYIAKSGVLHVSIIGVGGFAKTKILPIIHAIPKTSIHSVIDTNTAVAITIARVYKAQRVSNDYRKILGDDDIDVAIIATPHAFHTPQALHCLASGKAVMVEKPAAISYEQLDQLKTFFAVHKEVLYCVNFNRSHSPFMRDIKQAIKNRNNPLMINYRMNVGFLAKNHWQQSAEHRGRLIGEACHIFDLFCYLTDSRPLTITVSSLHSTSDEIASTDNALTAITMEDGSCCTLAYSSLGHKDCGKEYMELMFDGKTIIMKDFLELRGHGLPRGFSKRVSQPDKGHKQLYQQFFKAAHSAHEQKPIPIDRILTATEVSLIVDKLTRSGGGLEFFRATP